MASPFLGPEGGRPLKKATYLDLKNALKRLIYTLKSALISEKSPINFIRLQGRGLFSRAMLLIFSGDNL